MSSFLHWATLVLVGVGSGFIIWGFIRVSYANDGSAKKLATAIDHQWARLTHRKATVTATFATSWAVAGEPIVQVGIGTLDPALSEPQKIDHLWKMLQSLESNQIRINRDNFDARSKDRDANRAAHADLDARIKEVRSEFVTGLKQSAREGLRLAAVGAILVAVGDILGAALSL
jgi:hypothetical protein